VAASVKYERFFKKETSVFAKWNEDNDKIRKTAFENDISESKINKLIKDPED